MSVQDHLCSARIPTPVLTGLLIPASLLIILAIVPPHAFDLSVSKLFFSDGWPWHRNEVFTTIFYRLPKLVPAIVATVLLVRLAVVLAQGRRILEEEASRRALYVVIAMGACAAAVWWLKSTTGVACPWSVEPFGGALPMTDPAFGLTDVPGRCWPSGHAGTGFVFIAFYFALKDVRPRAAAGALLFAVAFGLLCGAVRVMEGAHFVSHVLVTGIVDWLICAALHALILENRSSPALAKPLSERGLVLLTAFWWTFVLNMPFLARAADLSEPNFAWSMREALLRRSGANPAGRLTAGPLSLDLKTLRVEREGRDIKLNPTCLQLLRELMQQSPGIVSRRRLEAVLWQGEPPASDSLRSNLYLLRQAVDKPFDRPLIHTHPGLGWYVADLPDSVS